jgi:hypothetical protein
MFGFRTPSDSQQGIEPKQISCGRAVLYIMDEWIDQLVIPLSDPLPNTRAQRRALRRLGASEWLIANHAQTRLAASQLISQLLESHKKLRNPNCRIGSE